MSSFGGQWLNIFIAMTIFIAAALVASYGGQLATESITDSKRRRGIKACFWLLFAIGTVFAFWQQLRLSESDQARDTREEWNQALLIRILFRPVRPPEIAYLKSPAPLSAKITQVRPKPQQNAPAGINIGHDNNGTAIVNNGPPPLELVPSVQVVQSDKPGLIKSVITIVPNMPVSAPTAIALEFDNPISSISFSISNVGAFMGGGPYRIGVHAMVSIGTGFGPQRPVSIVVYSEKTVNLVAPPKLE
jgi:hypothetical protein